MTLTHINTHAHRHTRSHPHTLKIMINVRRFSAVLGTYERWPVVIPCISIPCYIRVGLSRGSDRRSRRYLLSWRIRSFWRCYASASSSFRVQALVQTCEQNNQEFLCRADFKTHREKFLQLRYAQMILRYYPQQSRSMMGIEWFAYLKVLL